MKRVEIACFTTPEDAELAAEFLRLHGVEAHIPVDYITGRWATPATRIYVERSKAEMSVKLFRKVLAGEFDGANPYENSPEGLGAALAEAVLPAPGYRPPTLLEGVGPIVAALVLGLLVLAGRVIYELLATRGVP